MAMIEELAEAPTRFEVVGPGEELVDGPDCSVFFGAGTDARSCSVQRLRFSGTVEATVARVREMIRAKIMTLSTEPPAANPDIVVVPVDTIDEFRAHVGITHEVFGMLDRLPDELKRIESDGARKLADRSFLRYVARIDGVPAGAATATSRRQHAAHWLHPTALPEPRRIQGDGEASLVRGCITRHTAPHHASWSHVSADPSEAWLRGARRGSFPRGLCRESEAGLTRIGPEGPIRGLRAPRTCSRPPP